MHDGDTRAHGHLLHEDALTCSLSLSVSLSLSHTHTHIHNKTTDLLIASVRESRHRHCYTPAWLGMVTIYIRALSDPHPPNPVPVTMATNSEPPPPSMAGLQDQLISQLAILNIQQTDFSFA